jgi:outer membrane protein insertion porin family
VARQDLAFLPIKTLGHSLCQWLIVPFSFPFFLKEVVMKNSLGFVPLFLGLFLLSCIGALSANENNMVKSFQVEGNRLISEEVILLNVKMKAGATLNDKAIHDEIARIAEMGYFAYVGAEIRSLKTGKHLVFKVEENAIISEVDIQSNTLVSVEKMTNVMESKTGTVFNSKLLSQDIQNINDALAREGFLFSKVLDASVKEKGSRVHIEVNEGKISEIRIEGLEKTKELVIRRELTVKAGEVYDNTKIVRDLQRIYNLGFFEEVKRDHLPGKTPDEVVLVIQVVEGKTGRAGGGGGYSSRNGLVGFANFSFTNFLGEGKRVSLKTEFGGVKTYEVGYFDPWLNGKPRSLGVNVFNTKFTRNLYSGGDTMAEYDEKRKGGSISLGRRLRPDVDVSLRFYDEDVKLTPTDSVASLPTSLFNGRLQTLGAAIDKDTRDNRFWPTRGVHDTFSLETTGGLLRGSNQYTKCVLALRRFAALTRNRKTVLAFQGVGGRTDVGKGSVPVYDMFSVGGGETVRGYREREFLGTRFLYGNFEIRQRVAKFVDVVGFFDVGDAFGTDYNGFKKELEVKQGYGLGIRLQTPLGPVAIDHGKGTDRGDEKTYFNFGTSF